MSRFKRIVAWGLFTLTLMVLSGWLLADHYTPRAVGAPGHALPLQPAQTALDREVMPLVARHGGKTGALLVPDGLDAFAARALSARQAGRSLDLQYYIWHNDLTGRLLGREAWLAAERGVRVRMLLDDMNGEGADAGLLALDAHPNIEIRLYNPFRNRSGPWRVLELIQRIYSVNHRMHNKAWIADGRVAVLGGRNIGEEYFDAAPDTNFRDLDVVLFGPAVTQASAVFDRYWNSDAVVPIAALADGAPQRLDALVKRVHDEAQGQAARRYLARMDASPTVHGYFAQQLAPHWSDRIQVISDPPLKWKDDSDRSGWLVTRLTRTLLDTRRKALLISPYFVPGDAGSAGLVRLVRDRHATVAVITNSLAANDVPAVHSGYMQYRDRLLDGGVHLYEIRAQAPPAKAPGAKPAAGGDASAGSGSGLFGSSGASLHTKAFVVDDRHGFIGSFNLDPRSAYLNTEMGVQFDDPGIGAALRDEYLRLSSPKLSYWVFHDRAGDLHWLDRNARPPALLDREPDSTRTQRAIARVLGWLPIESQL
jgi:putative cardiolipin synthase